MSALTHPPYLHTPDKLGIAAIRHRQHLLTTSTRLSEAVGPINQPSHTIVLVLLRSHTHTASATTTITMAEDGSAAPQSPSRQRRSSFAGQTFADLFGTGRSRTSNDGGSNSPPGQYSGPISQAAAKAQQRRLSLTTLGLSGSPNGTSSYNSFHGRQDSISSANSGSIDESAIEDDVGPATAREPASATGSMPGTPFARRMSFGARALRDVSGGRTGGGGGGGGGGGSSGQNGTKSPAPANASINKAPPKRNGTTSSRTADAKGRGLFFALHDTLTPLSQTADSMLFPNTHADIDCSITGEGFNWSDNFRTRAERTASITGGQGSLMPSATGPGPGNHVRAKSVATMEPPVREMPKEQKRPDHFQERILKGDFYMD